MKLNEGFKFICCLPSPFGNTLLRRVVYLLKDFIFQGMGADGLLMSK